MRRSELARTFSTDLTPVKFINGMLPDGIRKKMHGTIEQTQATPVAR